MKDDVLLAQLNRLLKLVELARHAVPEDRACLERTIQLVSIARQAVAQVQEQRERVKRLAEEAEAGTVFQRNEQVILLAELRIMRGRTRT